MTGWYLLAKGAIAVKAHGLNYRILVRRKMKTLEQIRQELEVETLCSMNESRTISVDSTVGTFALSACTGIIAVGDRSVHLSHFDPAMFRVQIAHLNNFLRNEPTAKIHVAAVSSYVQDDNDEWIRQIDPRITSLTLLEKAVIIGYSALHSWDETTLSRSIRWKHESVLFGEAIAV